MCGRLGKLLIGFLRRIERYFGLDIVSLSFGIHRLHRLGMSFFRLGCRFRRDLDGSDFLHWGEGDVFVGRKLIALEGRIAPGPDYRLYLSPEFVETEADFARLKGSMVQVGAFSDPANAASVASSFRDRGLLVVQQPGADGLTRVFLGPYDDL